MQEGNENLNKKDNASGKPSDEKLVYNQGACPRIKKSIFNKENKSINQGSVTFSSPGSQIKKGCTIQNGAGCSSWLGTTGTPCFLNDVLGSDMSCANEAEKNPAKDDILFFKESDNFSCDAKNSSENLKDNDNSSGNEGDETFSGDDCCIYTYKGDQFVDLPNSFFSVHMPDQEENPNIGVCRRGSHFVSEERSNPGSSPEMDYLEMDFDPGPSLEQDLEEGFNGLEEQVINGNPVPDLPSEQTINLFEDINNLKIESVQNGEEPKPGPSCETFYSNLPKSNNIQSNFKSSRFNSNNDNIRTKKLLGNYQQGQCSFDKNSVSCDFGSDEKLEFENDDSTCKSLFIGDRRLDKSNFLTENKEANMNNGENEPDSKIPFDGIMLWTEQEAISNQVTMGSSEVSCGAIAVINVMLVLKMRFSIEKVKEGICSRLKTDSSSIPQYLVSRSFAGVAHENLIRGIHQASHGTLYAKFFQMYPKRDIVLSRWLSHWMKLGAVPIATMNVQRDSSMETSINDTRHHQMVYGVSSKGIHLTNPLECLKDEELWSRLTSPSVLNIKRQEIVSRWSPNTNLKPLMFQSDDRWKTMNVLGQVVNIIRESPDPLAQGKFLTQHISIPASSGITLVISRDSPGYEELVSTPELPLCSEARSK